MNNGNEFHCCDYNNKIKEAVSRFDFASNKTIVANYVTVKDTRYKKGMYVIIGMSDNGLLVGEVKLILINCDSL